MDKQVLPNEAFAKRLKEYRLKRRFTQIQMAEYFKLPRATYNYYENAKSIPDINLLASVAADTGYSMEYLLGLSEYKTYQHEINAKEAVESANDPGEEAMLRVIQTAKNLRMLSDDLNGQPFLDCYLKPLADICTQIDNILRYVSGPIEQSDGTVILETYADFENQLPAAYKACSVLLEKGFM